MAKRRKRRARHTERSKRIERDSRLISERETLFDPLRERRRRRERVIIDDRRYFRPDDYPRDFDGVESRLVSSTSRRDGRQKRFSADKIAFAQPLRSEVCKRRARRRETLFSLQKIGKGKGGAQRKRIMHHNSDIKC